MKLALQTVASILFGVLFFGLALFLPAWTFDYWQAWVFIAVFTVATMIPSLYLAMQHPAVLQRRLKAGPTAETRPVQRIVMSATLLLVVALLVLSAVDHRFGWSSVPVSVVILGDVLVGVGCPSRNTSSFRTAMPQRRSPSKRDSTSSPPGCTGWCGTRCTSVRSS